MSYSPLRAVLMISLAVALTFLHGCAGYRLGTSLPGSIVSVYVPTFVNDCGEPELEHTTTSATIEEFQKDGTLRVSSSDTADAVLHGTLIGYSLKTLRFSEDNATEPSEYRLTITAKVILKSRSTGETILAYPSIIGKSTFDLKDDIATAKTEALPGAATDLAHDIVERVVEGW